MYIVHNKVFQHKCDAAELSYQLCREHSRYVPHWHVVKHPHRMTPEDSLHGYVVWDTIEKEIVLDMSVMTMEDR